MPVPKRGDQRADLVRGQHLVKPRALDIEDFPAQRQDRLVLARAALLGGAARRVALHDEDFGFGRVAFLTIGELAGQGRDIERAFAAGELARFPRRLARGGGLDDLHHDRLRVLRVFLKPFGQLFPDQAFHHGADLGGDQLVLGLAGEFRIRHLHREHAGQALRAHHRR